MAITVDDKIYDKASSFSVDAQGNLKLWKDYNNTRPIAVIAVGSWHHAEAVE